MDLEQLIKDSSKNLPDDLQKLVNDEKLPDKIKEIARQNGLNESQREILKNETYFVLLGIEKITDFSKNLGEQIGEGLQKTTKISNEINDQIFRPVEITLLAMEELGNKAAREEKIRKGREVFEETLKIQDGQSSQKADSPDNQPDNPSEPAPEPVPENILDLDKMGDAESVQEEPAEEKYDISEFEKMASAGKAQSQNPDETKQAESPGQRFGIEPANDLNAEDFNWQGNVSGVEIENNSKDETANDTAEKNFENLDRKQILNEIEYPSAYTPESYEDKMNKTVIQETAKEEITETPKQKGSQYKQDPYREPLN